MGTGMVGAPACGDVMKLQIKVGPTGLIEDAKFKTYGCGSAIASSRWSPSGSRARRSTRRWHQEHQIAEELALPPVKIHCSILAEDAIKAAVADYIDAAAPSRASLPPGQERHGRHPDRTRRQHVTRYPKSAAGHRRAPGRQDDRLLGPGLQVAEYADELAPEDIVFEGHGVKVLVDPKSLPYIDGTELDFVREGAPERGLSSSTTRAKDRCGCGESFRV